MLNHRLVVISNSKEESSSSSGGKLTVNQSDVLPIFKVEKVPSNNSRSQNSGGSGDQSRADHSNEHTGDENRGQMDPEAQR